MRRLSLSLLVLALLAAVLPVAGSPLSQSTPLASAQGSIDDEIVYLQSDGRIVVYDPYTPAGIHPVQWQSPGTGWQKVATGDFNGDGDDEIVALRGGQATVFDPVVPQGAPAVTFNVTVAGETWEQVVTGDIDGDGRDEIIMTRTTSEGDTVERLQAYDSDPTGTTWTMVHNAGFGLAWQHLATGDVNNDGSDEVAAIRHRLDPWPDKRITIWNPSNNWVTIHDRGDYNFKWLTIEIGNTHADASGKEEILLTRTGVLGELNSFLIFRWRSVNQLDDVDGGKFFPYFFDIALGDVNGSGDEEVFLLRDASETTHDALIMRNYGDDQDTIVFETLQGQGQWKNIETGDTDADGQAELIVMSAGEMRIYNRPKSSENDFTSVPGNYASSGSFAVGNLDGQGIPMGPELSVSPTTIDLSLEVGETAARDIAVTNTGDDSVINWTAAVVDGASWLSVSPTTGTTPGQFQVRVQTASLLAGNYTGKVRVTAQGEVANSPQDVVVNLTLTAPQFSVTPSSHQWFYRLGTTSTTKTVRVYGPGLNWHAGVVPLSAARTLAAALQSGATIVRTAAGFTIDGSNGPQDVPVVDWVDVNPSSGTSSMDGSPVLLRLVQGKVPRGLHQVAVVFVADSTASPRAVVVDVSVVAYQDIGDLTFLPLAMVGP